MDFWRHLSPSSFHTPLEWLAIVSFWSQWRGRRRQGNISNILEAIYIYIYIFDMANQPLYINSGCWPHTSDRIKFLHTFFRFLSVIFLWNLFTYNNRYAVNNCLFETQLVINSYFYYWPQEWSLWRMHGNLLDLQYDVQIYKQSYFTMMVSDVIKVR